MNRDKIASVGAKGSFCLLLISLTLQVAITNKYAIKGGEMVSLQGEQFSLEKDVSLLRLSISEVSSLALIEERAEKFGFVEYNEPMAVISSSQFAAVSGL